MARVKRLERIVALTKELTEVENNGQTRILSFAPVKGLPSANWHIGLSIVSSPEIGLHLFR